jgi:hypothetical protein
MKAILYALVALMAISSIAVGANAKTWQQDLFEKNWSAQP